MFDLFRFIMLRPAGVREAHDILSTANDTDLQRQLERDRERPTPGPAMEQTANSFLKSEAAVSRIESLAFHEAYDTLTNALRAATPADRGGLLDEIRNAFGRDAEDLLQEQGFRDDRVRLADTLIAAKLGTPRIDLALDAIASRLRLIALIQRAADADVHLDTAAGIHAALDVSIALPGKLLPVDQPMALPEPPPGEKPAREPDRPQETRERQRDLALREYQELSEAHDYLRDLPADLVHDSGASADGVEGVGTTEPAERSEISDAIFRELRELRAAVLSPHAGLDRAGPDLVATGFAVSSARVLQGTTLKARREAVAEAPQAVHGGLRAARVDLARTSLSDAMDRINARRRELAPLVIDQLIGATERRDDA